MDEERLLATTASRGTRRQPPALLPRAPDPRPFFLLYFRLSRIGREHASQGPLIVASNHRSFLRPVRDRSRRSRGAAVHYVAKVELFEKRWQGWILNASAPTRSAGPVRRADADHSREESRAGAARFASSPRDAAPDGSLARPKRGFGRLALETGAAVLLSLSKAPSRSVALEDPAEEGEDPAGRALTFPRTEDPSPTLANSVGARIWPVIELQWEWLGGLRRSARRP